jgi:hypothetical protein
MQANVSQFNTTAIEDEIALRRKQLETLHRSLAASEKSLEDAGFADVPNPVADRLRKDIQLHEALLEIAQQTLLNFAQ